MIPLPTTLTRFIWHFAQGYLPQLIGLVSITAFYAIQMSLSAYMLKMMIDGSLKQSEAVFEAIAFPALIYFLLAVLLTLLYRVYEWLIVKTFPSMKSQMIAEMFDYIKDHSYGYFQQSFAGSFSSKINDIATGIPRILVLCFDHFLTHILALLVASVTMYFVHPGFSLILLTWSSFFIVVSLFLAKQSKKYSAACADVRSDLLGRIVDTLSNILSVKLFVREESEKSSLNETLEAYTQKETALGFSLMQVKTFQSVGVTCLVGMMVGLLVYERTHHRITAGDFALILTLTTAVIAELFAIGKHMTKFAEEFGICHQALSVITAKHDLINKPDASPLKLNQGEIVFDRIQFRHQNGKNLFTNISLTIAPGEKVGLVGFSGSGKSTFIHLILRCFDIDSGAILIDNQNIQDVTQASLRDHIAVIPQNPILFHRSIMENIRYGCLTASDEEVYAAAKQAHCHTFIDEIPGGYHALAGERGIKLSGGQRQQIAIARALLKKAPILIIDEATSSLDSITENRIQHSLKELMVGCTTLVIAHRLSSVLSLDRLLIFHAGQIIEEGTHEQLLASKGSYAKLWQAYSTPLT